MNDYTAVLLAAGYGSRIASLTDKPKSLLKLGEATLLERHFQIWKNLKIKKVNLVLGYKEQLIRAVAQKYEHDFEIQYLVNADYVRVGNTYSMLLGLEKATGPVLVFDADLVYEEIVLKDFLSNPQQDQILIGKNRIDDIECAKALADQNNFIRKTVDKRAITPEELKQYHFVGEAIGILKFSAKMNRELVTATKKFFLEPKNLTLGWEHLLNVFLPQHDVGMHLSERGKWIEIDTPEDFAQAQEKFN